MTLQLLLIKTLTKIPIKSRYSDNQNITKLKTTKLSYYNLFQVPQNIYSTKYF